MNVDEFYNVKNKDIKIDEESVKTETEKNDRMMKMDNDKILEKYLDAVESQRRESELRIATSISELKKELREDRKNLEENLSKQIKDIDTKLDKVNNELNTKLDRMNDKITQTSTSTIKWVMALVLGAMISMLGMTITLILKIWNP